MIGVDAELGARTLTVAFRLCRSSSRLFNATIALTGRRHVVERRRYGPVQEADTLNRVLNRHAYSDTLNRVLNRHAYSDTLNRVLNRHAYSDTLNRVLDRHAYSDTLNRVLNRHAYSDTLNRTPFTGRDGRC